MACRTLHREVFPEGDSITYRELVNVGGRIAQVHITRSPRLRKARIDIWSSDSWRPVVQLSPAVPEARHLEGFQSADTFQLDRDELVRRFCLVCATSAM